MADSKRDVLSASEATHERWTVGSGDCWSFQDQRSHVVDRGVAPLTVIKHPHIFEETCSSFVRGPVVAVHYQLGLQRVEEAFHRRVDAPMSSFANEIRQIPQK